MNDKMVIKHLELTHLKVDEHLVLWCFERANLPVRRGNSPVHPVHF